MEGDSDNAVISPNASRGRMAEISSEDSILLHLEKEADWGRPITHGIALAFCTSVVVIAFLYVSLHPFIWAFIFFVLVVAGILIVRRSLLMRSEMLTFTLREVVVEQGGEEKRYVLGPSTRVHLDTELRQRGQQVGPLKEITFQNRGSGDAIIAVDNGWKHEQVNELFQVLLPMVEPRDIQMSIMFKRYLAARQG